MPRLQAQVDWKESMKLVNKHGEIFEINIFLMILGYSRYKYIKLTSDKNQNTLFKCIVGAFRYFNGCLHITKTISKKIKNKKRIINT